MDARRARIGSGILFLNLAGLAACSGGGSGEVVYTGPTYDLVHEIEPNDAAFLAQPIGALSPGDRVLIEGSICGTFCDPADGYATTVYGPCVIDFQLSAASAFADFDLCVYDPVHGVFTSCFESGGPFEQGSILVQSYAVPLHLVVVPFAGEGPYSLALDVSPIYLAAATEMDERVESVAPRASGASQYARASEDEVASVDAEIVATGFALAFDEAGAMTDVARVAVLAAGE